MTKSYSGVKAAVNLQPSFPAHLEGNNGIGDLFELFSLQACLNALSHSDLFLAPPCSPAHFQTSDSLSSRASYGSAGFSHAPGIEQFGEPLFREDVLFGGHLPHRLARLVGRLGQCAAAS